MKIALNIDAVGKRRGGAEAYAATLARALVAAGHEVHVFAREVEPGTLQPKVCVHRVTLRQIPGLGLLRAWRFARASEALLRAEHFDLIVGFIKVWYQHVYLAVGGTHPATLRYNSRRLRSPIARAAWWLSKTLNAKQWVFRAIARRQFHGPHAPHVIAPSRMVARHFQEDHAVAPQRISVVYNGIDGEAVAGDAIAARADFRRHCGLGPEDVAVLFVARNYAMKGLEPLVEAFARVAQRHAQARLVVCGNRRDARYRRQAHRLGIAGQVMFLGPVEDVRAAFAGSDVFAFPTFYDPCSLVVPEAMAAGLPVITTRQNGAGELVGEGEDGFVIDFAWKLDQLSDRLHRLVTEPALRKRLGEHARQKAQRLTMSSLWEELWAALARAASDPLASPSVRDAA